jgi:flagellar biosynthesis protein FliQ
VALLFCFPWMLELVVDFTRNVFLNIPAFAR